jgi:hypothetical protein
MVRLWYTDCVISQVPGMQLSNTHPRVTAFAASDVSMAPRDSALEANGNYMARKILQSGCSTVSHMLANPSRIARRAALRYTQAAEPCHAKRSMVSWYTNSRCRCSVRMSMDSSAFGVQARRKQDATARIEQGPVACLRMLLHQALVDISCISTSYTYLPYQW